MTINYNVTGNERKRLADYIAGFLGCEKKYLGAPTMAYQAGYITVSRDGAITFDDRADSKEIETLLEELEHEGFHAEDGGDTELPEIQPPVAAPAAEDGTAGKLPDESENGGESENVGLTVEIPLDKVQAGNLTNLLDAKGSLIKKALGIPATPIEITGETVRFPWFPDLPEPDAVKAYTHFIAALCEMSREQKRISSTERPVENEKYAFRCFLLRLGFIGKEYAAERKILLHNLTGSSAFKSGARKTVSSVPDSDATVREATAETAMQEGTPAAETEDSDGISE